MNRWVSEIPFLILKELAGTLAEEEKRTLDEWKSTHKNLYGKLRDPEEVGKHAAQLSDFPAEKGWEIVDRRIRRLYLCRKILIAASFLLPMAITISLAVNVLNNRNMPTYALIEAMTGRGGDSTLVLPDGSLVRLNSMSRLSYPERFAGGSRDVYLEGEAFFDVTPSSQPFTVNTGKVQVQVLGTSFNVSAYSGKETSTVLVNGSVKVKCADMDSCVLNPGQMAYVSAGESCIIVRDVDTELYTSWKDGKFCCRDERLEDIIQKLSMRYDFTVEYADEDLRNLRFGCYVDSFEEVSSFFHLLERTGKIRLNMTGNHYVISSPQ